MLTVPEGDNTALLSAVRRVLLDETLAATLAGKVGGAARRFKWEGILAEHRQIYAAALARRRRRH